MRIAYLTADFGVPVLGTKGASVHVRQMVAALAGLGHELVILTPSPGQGGSVEPLPCRLEEIPLGGAQALVYEELKQEELCRGNRLSKDLRNLLYAASLELQARPILETFGPDFLYERYSLFGTAGVQLARHLQVPLILEVNAPLVEEQRKQRGLSLPGVASATERAIFAEADHVLVVSQWLEEHVRSHGGRRVSVVPNAADPDLFRPVDEPSPLRRQLGWQDRFVLGFVGSMKGWHGVGTLIETLGRLGGPESGFRLLLVGDGPDLPALQEHIEESGLKGSVHVTGAVPHDDVPGWIGAMDVTLAPYAASADPYFSPVKLFEYMAMGVPVVAARIEQTVEIIEDGRTGWLYTPGDAAELAERLRWLEQHRHVAAEVGAAARQLILDRHTWRRNAERVLRVFEELGTGNP